VGQLGRKHTTEPPENVSRKEYLCILLPIQLKIKAFSTFTLEETLLMMRNILLICLLLVSTGIFAQSNQNSPAAAINRRELLDKTWHIVAMKCPEKVNSNNDGHYIHYMSSLKMVASNVNNINYGTYQKTYMDVRDNPNEKGTYAINTDDVGNVVLTLKKSRTGTTAKYIVSMVETNHVTFIRTDDGDKCNISYGVAP
jgi:hypothetical protein